MMLHTTKTDVVHPGTTDGLPYKVWGNFTPAAKKQAQMCLPFSLCEKTTGTAGGSKKAFAMPSPAAATCLPLMREVDSP